MADSRSIHQFPSEQNVTANTLFLIDKPNQSASSGYDTEQSALSVIGKAIVNLLEYTQELDTTDKTIIGAINEIFASAGGSANANIAADFDTTATYEVGDYVIYNGLLYKCTTAVETAGAWDSSDWTQTVVTDELGSGSIPDISNVVFPIVGGE